MSVCLVCLSVKVVRALLEDGRYEPLLHVRDKAAAKASIFGTLPMFECDVTASDSTERIADALQQYQVQSVICTLGFVPTFISADDLKASEAVDNKGVVALIRAAEQAALPGRFVLVSSLLTSIKTRNLSAQLLNSLGGVLDAKAVSEDTLAASSLDYTILRPGVFPDTPVPSHL